MKKILFAAAGLVLYSTLSFSQAGGNAIYSNQNNNYQGVSPNHMANGVDLNLQLTNSSFSSVLEANIMINVKATAYVAIFSISQHGNSIEDVERMIQARIELFKQKIANEGGAWKIFVDPVALVPTYEIEVTEKKFSKTLNEQPSGFEIKKNIHITFGDHDHINRLITLAAQAEVYDLVKVDYAVDNMDNIIEQLRQEALVILDRKKKSMETAGMHVRFSNFGERYGSVYPLERYASYYAYKTGVAPSFATRYKKGTPQQTIQYNYAEKNKTIYYEKVSDKQFDKVINPVVGEPQVQVYLSMKASYSLYNPDTEKEQLAYDAKLKELKLREMELNLEEKKKDIELKEKQITAKSK
jgi:hypothetical protein